MFFTKLFRPKNLPAILIITSIISYIYSLRIVANDPFFYNRWFAFGLHSLSLLAILFLYLSKSLSKGYFKKVLSAKERNPIIIILAVTILANFLLLAIYPYISISDPLRDGGLFAMKIASGVQRNIFSYGSYDGYGLIVPTLDIPFYYLFGNSVLTYRFLAALLSTLDVLFLYILIRLIVNRSTAFWSALVLATLPLHMFFAHTQIVIAFDFLGVPLILLVLYKFLKTHRYIDYIFMGTILGFASGFYAAIRVFACLVFLILLFFEGKSLIGKKFNLKENRMRLAKVGLLLVFLFVGFGPRLLFTGTQDFFHSSRFIFENQHHTNASIVLHDLSVLKNNYIRSVMVYTYEPTTFFYPVTKPILTPFLSVFFLLGMGYALFVLKNSFINILLFLLIVLPFFTSAITDWVNASQRVTPQLAIASVFTALGITCITSLIKNKPWRYIFIAFMFCYLAVQLLTFYTKQPANKNIGMPGYLDMHMFHFLQQEEQYQAAPATYLHDLKLSSRFPDALSHICLYVSPANYQNYMSNYIAYHEQQQFFLSGVSINYGTNIAIKNNEVYIIKNRCSSGIPYTEASHTYTVNCSTGNSYTCPLNYSGKILIHY